MISIHFDVSIAINLLVRSIASEFLNQVFSEKLNKELEAQGALDNNFYSESLNNSAFKPILKR